MNVETILPLLLKAGEEVLKIYNSDFDITWKKESDPLTQADLLVNKILTEALENLTPNIPILSEESMDNLKRLESQKVWILDPIDGTREFVKKNPEFAISLGFVENGRAKFGFILNPVTKQLIYGGENYGVFYAKDFSQYSAKQVILSYSSNSPKPILLLSPSEVRDGLFQDVFWKENFSIQIIGSIAYKLGLLSIGYGDLVISARPKNEWDVCAGIALVLASRQECFTLLDFQEYIFNENNTKKHGLIAGKKEIVDKLIKQEEKRLKETFQIQ